MCADIMYKLMYQLLSEEFKVTFRSTHQFCELGKSHSLKFQPFLFFHFLLEFLLSFSKAVFLLNQFFVKFFFLFFILIEL